MPRRPKLKFLGKQGMGELKFTSDPKETSPWNPNVIIDLFRFESKTKNGSWGLGRPLKIRRSTKPVRRRKY